MAVLTAALLLPAVPQWGRAIQPNTGYRFAAAYARDEALKADYLPVVCLETLREAPVGRFMLGDPHIKLGSFDAAEHFAGRRGAIILADRGATHNDRLSAFLHRLDLRRLNVMRFQNPFPFLWPLTDEERQAAARRPDLYRPDPRYVTVYVIAPVRENG